VKALYFLAIMLTAIALGAGLAHLFELPNKIGLDAQDYLTVQRNYDNWWIVGLVVPLAFVSVLALTIALRGTGAPFILALIALGLLVIELATLLGLHRASQPRHHELYHAAQQLGGASHAMGIFTRHARHPLCARVGRARHVGARLALRSLGCVTPESRPSKRARLARIERQGKLLR
jgi:hypothetical protein